MRLILIASLALVSCKEAEQEKSTSTPEPAPGPTHPWDWKPDDSALKAGRTVYLAECAGCHNEGEEGAPALTRLEEWTKREEKGLPVLFEHAINGFDGIDGEMPARGGTPSLTDEQVKQAVTYMIKAALEDKR